MTNQRLYINKSDTQNNTVQHFVESTGVGQMNMLNQQP